jgi:multiple sugar transport system permease protein
VPAAYALGRLRPPGWRWWRRALFATYVIPQTILFIPMYQVVLALGFDDSPSALVVIYSSMALPFCIWLLSAYYGNLPREIEESALIEGATRLAAFRRIMLPMSRNVLVAAGLFTLGTVGQDFMLASIFLLDRHKQTVAAGLGVMDVSLEELVAVAGVNLAAIPVVLLCALFARRYVTGLTAAMVEGA